MPAARVSMIASALASALALVPPLAKGASPRAGAPAAGRPVVSTPSSTPLSTPLGPTPFVVAIDAGHGGSNLGAVGASGGEGGPDTELLEKDVTLALARRLAARLAATPGVRVVSCRDRDVLVPIRARSRCAAEAHADLFLSVHANATPAGVAPGSQRGFELYVLSPDDVEEDATLAALAVTAAGHETAGAWASHEVRALAPRAAAAARALDRRLKEALGAGLARGLRQSGAALDVLRGTHAPSVLVEVGFLDSPLDRAVLGSPAGQDRVAGALAAAALDLRAAATR